MSFSNPFQRLTTVYIVSRTDDSESVTRIYLNVLPVFNLSQLHVCLLSLNNGLLYRGCVVPTASWVETLFPIRYLRKSTPSNSYLGFYLNPFPGR